MQTTATQNGLAVFIKVNEHERRVESALLVGEDVRARCEASKEAYERSSGWDGWKFEFVVVRD